MSKKLDQLEELLSDYIRSLEGEGYEDLTVHIKRKGGFLVIEIHDANLLGDLEPEQKANIQEGLQLIDDFFDFIKWEK
jgi:hypothetical protein